MNYNDTWTISDPNADGNVNIIVGLVHRGPAMSPAQARDIVDCHHADRVPFESKLREFEQASREFLREQFSLILDDSHEATGRNYWAMLIVMVDTWCAQLSAAEDSNLLKFKPMPGDTDYIEPETQIKP